MSKPSKDKNGNVWTNEDILTPLGRFVWVYLVTPKASTFAAKPGEAPAAPKYSCGLLLKKDDPKVAAFRQQVIGVVNPALELKNEGSSTTIGIREVFKDGDSPLYKDYPYYKNMWLFTGGNPAKPEVFDKDLNRMDPAKLVGGMMGRFKVSPFIVNSGVSYRLYTVQFYKDDGTRFGAGAKDPLDMMTKIEDAIDEGEDIQSPISFREQPDLREQPKKATKGKDAIANIL